MTIDELQALTPNFDWRKYAAASEAPPLPTINVAVPDYLKALNGLITRRRSTTSRRTCAGTCCTRSADLLPKAFVDENFDFFSAHARRAAGAARRAGGAASTHTDGDLGEALGQAFVEETFGPQAKADTLKMVQDIKDAMRQDIDAAPG